jgi:phage FluMu protein Com
MRLSIQGIVTGLLISTTDVMAENLIRYLFNNGEAQSGLECTPSEIEKIETIFRSVQTPLNLRKRDVEIKERLLHFNSDNIHTINFDNEIAEYHLPSCDDSCEGYLPDTCFAFRHSRRELSIKERELPKIVLDATNSSEAVTTQLSDSCRDKCRGYTSGTCLVLGCLGYRRDLEDVNRQEERELPKIVLDATNSSEAVTTQLSDSCRDKCRGYTSGTCLVLGCLGYRRDLEDVNRQEERELPKIVLDVTNSSEAVTTQLSDSCRDKCRGYTSGTCLVLGCLGYRRALAEVKAPEEWCVKAAKAIDEKLNELLVQHQVSEQCQALILAPRRMECYNDQAIC